MNLLRVLVQEHGSEAPSVFAIAQNVSFWTVVIFLLLLVVLTKYAFPPILGYAAARERRIRESMEEAQRAREEAAALLAQQRQELGAARQEAAVMITEARQAAETLRQEMIAQARTEQSELIERATQEIVRERERALEMMRREAVDLAIAAAGKLIERRLGEEEDRRLVSEYLGRAVDRGAN